MRSLEGQAAAIRSESSKLQTDLDDVCAALRTAETAAVQFINNHLEDDDS